MQERIKEAIREAWSAAWDRGEVEVLDDLMTEDFQRFSRASRTTKDLAGLKREITGVRAAFPDLSTSIDNLVVDGDTVVIFWTSRGTHEYALDGVPPTHREVETRGSNIITLRDGRVARESVTWDGSEILSGLGIRALRDAPGEPDGAVAEAFGGDPAPEAMKGFNRQFVTGVTVVTTMEGGVPRGLAVNAYCSISFEPPLVMVCVQKTSTTYPALFASSHLGINILSHLQKGTVQRFASKAPDKFDGVAWHRGPNGSPLIDGSSAALEGEIHERFQAKTHTIFVCRVRHAEVNEAVPMVYKAGRFYDGDRLVAL